MQPRAILIEKNPHLREQLAETMRRLGIGLAASYDALPATWREEVAALRPALVIFPMKHAHAGCWRLVREMQTLPSPPVLMALAPVETPAIRQSALDHGVDYVFDPLTDLDGFLAALREVASSYRVLAS